ncbi:hypothetical protein B4U80_08940, partial [Leptotrombidium deliense]
INGLNTQGENIADNGGLHVAYKAYKNYVKKYGSKKNKILAGPMSKYSGDQLFFISFATLSDENYRTNYTLVLQRIELILSIFQIWCENNRKESIRETIQYGSHCPSRFRVIGTLQNLKEFADAFHCAVGSRMHPKHKCVLW